jgi:hypothetical protein
LSKYFQLRVWQEGLHNREGVADACDRSLGEEFEYFLRGFAEPLQQGPRVCFTFNQWIHHVHQLLGGPPEVFELSLSLLFLLAQRLDSLKAVDELSLSIADHLLQPLDVIYTAIEQVLHISKKLFFTH